MDLASMAAAMVGAQMRHVQMATAVSMMLMNAAAVQSVAQFVQAAEQNAANLANVAAGIGRNVNLSA